MTTVADLVAEAFAPKKTENPILAALNTRSAKTTNWTLDFDQMVNHYQGYIQLRPSCGFKIQQLFQRLSEQHDATHSLNLMEYAAMLSAVESIVEVKTFWNHIINDLYANPPASLDVERTRNFLRTLNK